MDAMEQYQFIVKEGCPSIVDIRGNSCVIACMVYVKVPTPKCVPGTNACPVNMRMAWRWKMSEFEDNLLNAIEKLGIDNINKVMLLDIKIEMEDRPDIYN